MRCMLFNGSLDQPLLEELLRADMASLQLEDLRLEGKFGNQCIVRAGFHWRQAALFVVQLLDWNGWKRFLAFVVLLKFDVS